MSELDVAWAIAELEASVYASGMDGMYQRESDEVVAEHAHVTEQILDRVLCDWRTRGYERSRKFRDCDRRAPLRDAASRGIAALKRRDELRERLGDSAPHISAGDFHLWIWSVASSLWQSGHYRESVEGAIRKPNAEAQNKLRRRDISVTDLFNQAFSEQPPAAGKPRLHRMKDGSSTTFKSVQRGARTFAGGVFAGIRHPLAHVVHHEMSEQRALEYLAPLSVLVRSVDDATLETAS
ncbi:hypothetical protein GCM10027568_22250 [Humibacter soli]